MITLGLNAAFHDSAAALVVDGRLVAAAEEERFSRIKHGKRPVPFSTWELPFGAIAHCLREAGLTLADIDQVGYSFDPWRFAEGRPDLQPDAQGRLGIPSDAAAADAAGAALAPWDNPWDPLFHASVLAAPAQLADGAPHHLQRLLWPPGSRPRWRFVFLDHHLCHQASAFLAAPFERCAVMTLDGRGERASTTYGVWRDQRYQHLGEVTVPHSLGLLYERLTTHLGFLHSSDEYKVMALAAMGRPRWAEALGRAVQAGDGGRFVTESMDLSALVGPARRPGEPLGQSHFDLAASLQQVLEDTVLRLTEWLRERTGERQLAMAGGVALNCVMNARLRDEGPFDAVWVQPAAGDAGTALGAALWLDARARAPSASAPPSAPQSASAPADPRTGERGETAADAAHGLVLAPRQWQMDHAYWGPGWDDAEIEPLLRWAHLAYEKLPDETALAERVAELIERQFIIGWYQGRMEWGPRALGARSILASPTDPGMQARLNELKDREDFRPVAPAVTQEHFAEWFEAGRAQGGRSPFMLFTHRVEPARAARIPSACHTDGSARVQTVDAASNPRFHALLTAVGRRTGVPVLVNTSFNVRGQPVVCSPRDALEAFFTTPLQALVMGRFVIVKADAEGGGAATASNASHDVGAAVAPLAPLDESLTGGRR